MSFQIETKRLLIRDIEKNDIPILVSQFAEPISQKNILSRQKDEARNKKTLEDSIEWAKHPERIYYGLAVILKSSNMLIGNCTLSKTYYRSRKTSIGWHYGNQFCGNGYATEAAEQLLFIGFKLHEVSRIYADCFEDNKASIRIMEKLGMTSHLNTKIINKLRGLRYYRENKSTVRYSISINQWQKRIKSILKNNKL